MRGCGDFAVPKEKDYAMADDENFENRDDLNANNFDNGEGERPSDAYPLRPIHNANGQLILPDGSKLVKLPIQDELKESYLTYSMSVIVSRAIPDARDGLKPSQRRILVAMNDLGLGPHSQRVKCAKISGDASGNYHPHGEAIIYPTLVRMAQDWNMRHVLVDKQGNFGSIAGLPPAFRFRHRDVGRFEFRRRRLYADVRRNAHGTASSSFQGSELARQRGQRYRRRYGDEYSAAQSWGSLRRGDRGD